MAKNNLYKIAAGVAIALLTVSCSLKEEKDIFDKSASERIQDLQTDIDKTLQAAEYGWAMHFYPVDPSYGISLGGYEYTAVFDQGQVTIGSERNGTTTETSYYNIPLADGATLSFDTYNSIIHYWATPSGSFTSGRGGDVDFIIESVDKDLVVLKGKRWGARIELEPLTKEPAEYLADVRAAKKAFDIEGGIVIDGHNYYYNLYQTTASAHQRLLILIPYDDNGELIDDEELDLAYTVTPECMHLEYPVTIGDVTVQDLVYDSDTYAITTPDGKDLGFGHPFSYQSVDDLVGDYTLTYNKENADDEEFDTLDVSIKKSDTDGVLLLSGLNDNWDISMVYDDWYGSLTIPIQTLTQYTSGSTNKYLRFCFATYARAINATTGAETENISTAYFRYQLSGTYYTRTYDELVWDQDKTLMVNAYAYNATYPNTAWYLEGFNGNSGTSTTGREQPKAETGLRFPSGSLYLPYVYSLTKK